MNEHPERDIGMSAQQMQLLYDKHELLLGAVFLLLEDEPEEHEHFGCDRVGAECSWCYARKAYEEARP